MIFASDNCGPALPEVMDAVVAANSGFQASYGADEIMDEVRDLLRAEFEAPDASVYLVATGTAANALALSTLAKPWDTIFCTPLAHIHVDECHAPEFFTGGGKLTLVGEQDKMTPKALETAIAAWTKGDVHTSQRGPLALTQVTERGRVYSLDEITALTSVAKAHGLSTHMDGARFANAMASLGCSAAEMTWQAGIDAVSFGGTKNGCLGVEAVIFFDPEHAWEFELRRKRGAHLFSKHRYLSAQMQGYLRGGVWKRAAEATNAKAARMIKGLSAVPAFEFLFEPAANMIFGTLPRAIHRRLLDAGARYELHGDLEGPGEARLGMRLVVGWSVDDADIDRFVEIAAGKP
ncbi:MAG: beta-eliminating lyase-related protein [Pseudomonadota bacterium]